MSVESNHTIDLILVSVPFLFGSKRYGAMTLPIRNMQVICVDLRRKLIKLTRETSMVLVLVCFTVSHHLGF